MNYASEILVFKEEIEHYQKLLRKAREAYKERVEELIKDMQSQEKDSLRFNDTTFILKTVEKKKSIGKEEKLNHIKQVLDEYGLNADETLLKQLFDFNTDVEQIQKIVIK
jgi:hypothetical protein